MLTLGDDYMLQMRVRLITQGCPTRGHRELPFGPTRINTVYVL